MHSHSPPEKSSLLRAGQVVGSVVGAGSLAFAGSPAVGDLCDVVEFRADALAGEMDALRDAMAACPVPSLLTVRAPEEGGIGGLDAESREKILIPLLPQARLVDIEIAHLATFPAVLEEARRRGVPLVASFHDFTGTPDRSLLEERMRQAVAAGAAAVKFATTLRNSTDLATLASLQESSPIPLSTMGMGPLGRVSRLLLASLGSVLNYGYLDEPTVPGQWPAQRLRAIIRELRGEESAPPRPPA